MTRIFCNIGGVSSYKTTGCLKSFKKDNSEKILIRVTTEDLIEPIFKDVVTKCGSIKSSALWISKISQIPTGYECYYIDEAHFLGNNDKILDHDKWTNFLDRVGDSKVYIYGIDLDYEDKPFNDFIGKCVLFSEDVTKTKSRCFMCNKDAGRSLKIKGGAEKVEEESVAEEIYKPICYKCKKEN